MDFSGMRLLITGGTSGIGKAAARMALERGASEVIIFGRRPIGEEVAAELREGGRSVRFLRVDVSDGAQVREGVEAAAAGKPLNAILSIAGWAEAVKVAELDDSTWRSIIDVNLTANFWLTKHGPRHLADGSAIVMTSSILGFMGKPGLAPYSAAKAGLAGLMRVLVAELAPRRIRVNIVAPGSTETPMMWGAMSQVEIDEARLELAKVIPLGRLAQPEEAAAAALFLASPLASFVNGTTLLVDGGVLATYPSRY